MTLVHERTTQFLEGMRRTRREIVTPEGVVIPVVLAEYGERVIAFLIDWVIQTVAGIAVFVPIVLLIRQPGITRVAISIALFIAFLIRNLYFVGLELAWRGATPGKRLAGLRVIDRRGGPLQPSAVVARNLTREVEMFLPLTLLMSAGGAAGTLDLGRLFLGTWLIFFAALPLINRDRMRGGDLIAGTIVVSLPRRALSSELVGGAAQFRFTDAQLKAYGAFELQVLEELLRRPETAESAQTLGQVCEMICRKIGWSAPVAGGQVVPFLRDFYAAERAFLEREQLFGKIRADKLSPPKRVS